MALPPGPQLHGTGILLSPLPPLAEPSWWWTGATAARGARRTSRPVGPGSADAHGFGDVTFHGLRHGAAILLLAAGVPDAMAVRIMGHADTKILRRYQDVIPALQREAAERMNALLADRSYLGSQPC